jgi:hypothetical protein
MKTTSLYTFQSWFVLLSLSFLSTGCGLNPQTADVDLNNTLPEAKWTVYQEAVRKLGLMTQLYKTPQLNIMSKPIGDNTGAAVATRSEIPNDITEMVKSTLNAIGGNITYIPYDPSFIINSAETGYSGFDQKVIPDVVVTGGITEFDRGLVTKGDSANIDATIGDFGLSIEDQNKGSLAQVTLDFNLIDFKTLAAIPRIQAINGIKLHKATKEDSFGFTVKSVTFGAKGTIKKVQGRHAAIRLLTELSMVQLVGRYLQLPYWRLLPGGNQDDVVIDQLKEQYWSMSEPEKIAKIQSYLYLYNYPVNITGYLDANTNAALQKFAAQYNLNNPGVNEETFLALYTNIPVNFKTLQLSKTMPPMPDSFQLATQQTPQPVTTTTPLSNGEIRLWTDKSEYAIGEQMVVSFSVNQPMYVRLIVINSNGEISTLFPNPYQSDSYCKPGIIYQIPPANADFTLDIGKPRGIDKIRAIASNHPIAADEIAFLPNGQFDESKMSSFKVRAATDIVIQ